MKIYKQADLDEVKACAKLAQQAMLDYIDKHGLRDGGSCTIGEGIEINLLPRVWVWLDGIPGGGRATYAEIESRVYHEL